MRAILKSFFIIHFSFFICIANAAELFDPKEPVQDGINVFETSAVFSDIYTKLDKIAWGGKDISVAIESLEKINSNAHIAATDERVVLVWHDAIVANYPKPANRDWDAYGQITTALVLKLRGLDPALNQMSASEMYQTVVDALMRGVDENGRYIYSKQAEILEDGRILTSVGLDGGRDERENFRVMGVYKDSPADTSGVRAGDIITKINGKRIAEMSDDQIGGVLSGFNSGTLKLTVLTPGGEKQIVLRRATVVLADADIIYRSGESTGILEIVVHRVSDNAVAIVNEALAKHASASGIILDLRAATGNDERAAAKLAGLFVGAVPVMRIVETARAETEIVPGGRAVTDAPMVVLMSNTTRGTAEAIVGAMYENKRGILVGTPTAGSARIATTIDLENGGALELLNKSLKTGNGNQIDGRGIFPLVCLSNIRSDSQQNAFFLNVINNDFRARDFNNDMETPVESIRKGCPVITSGTDEDNLSAAVAVKILTDEKVYSKLINE